MMLQDVIGGIDIEWHVMHILCVITRDWFCGNRVEWCAVRTLRMDGVVMGGTGCAKLSAFGCNGWYLFLYGGDIPSTRIFV
jgi:hypothetical protein